MVKYLVDTDILIDHLSGKEPAVTFIKHIGGVKNSAISVITLAELLEGVQQFPEKLKHIESLISHIQVIPIDIKIAGVFGKLRYTLRQKKELIDNMDLFIAATALTYKLTLVTGNKKDFRRIKELGIANAKS